MANDAMATTPKDTALAARPTFIKEGDVRGTENISTADMKPPALRIAQSMSPETKRSEGAVYIQGLVEGNIFNSTTREIYGEGPIDLVIINQLGHRHIEFAPQSEGGGVLDFNVPDGDPRTEFSSKNIDGKDVRIKPRATKFIDFLVMVNGTQVMTMSMKSTQLKKAVQLCTQLKMSKLPSFAHLYHASAVPEKRGNNSFYGWRIEPAGWVTEEVYNECSAQYDKMMGKAITIEVDRADAVADEDIPF